MKRAFNMFLILLPACGGVSEADAPASDPVIEIEVSESRRALVMLPPKEEACIDVLVEGRRSCFPEGRDIPGDLRERSNGGLFVEGFGLKDRSLALHLSDNCSHYLCLLVDSCLDAAARPMEFYTCVDYTRCCVAVLEQ